MYVFVWCVDILAYLCIIWYGHILFLLHTLDLQSCLLTCKLSV